MKKSEFKTLLKPIIKECIKEVIFEEGVLSNIVLEVAQGLGRTTLTEAPQPTQHTLKDDAVSGVMAEQRRAARAEQKQKLLSAINTDAYGGVNVFEDTTPLSSGGSVSNKTETQGALSGVDPADPGVDISGIVGLAGNRWSAHLK